MTVNWFTAEGGEQLPEHWHDETTLCLHLERPDLKDDPNVWGEVLMIFNPSVEDVAFVLPDFGEDDWTLELSTAEPERSGDRISAKEPFVAAQRSLLLFQR
jgi:glycogen operon protein